MSELNLYVAFIAIWAATFLRTYLPARAAAARAKREGKPFEWNHTYSLSAGSSLALALLVVTVVFAGFQVSYDAHPLFVATSAFSYGFVQNQMFNQVVEWAKEAFKP